MPRTSPEEVDSDVAPPAPTTSEVVSIRFRGNDIERLQELAVDQEESVSSLVRRAVAKMLEGGWTAVSPAVDSLQSGARWTRVHHVYSGSSTEIAIPDHPPATVQGTSTTAQT